MRRLLFVLFFFALVFTTLFEYANAASLYRPLGGRILTTTVPNVKCATGTGPIFIQPVGVGNTSGPYLATFAGKRTRGQVQSQKWFLGNIDVLQENCVEVDGAVERPYSTRPFIMYGVSGY